MGHPDECNAGAFIGATIVGAILGLIPWFNVLFYITWGVLWRVGLEEGYFGWIALPLFVIPIFLPSGYGIGKTIGRIAERGIEEKEKLEVYKTKLDKWKREGYDISDFRERWFK